MAAFAFLGLILGLLVGGVISSIFTKPAHKRAVGWLALLLCLGSWAGYGAGLVYWHDQVEPTLDGTEGAGVGFGSVFVHSLAILPALFMTGFCAAHRLVQKGNRHKPSGPPAPTEDL